MVALPLEGCGREGRADDDRFCRARENAESSRVATGGGDADRLDRAERRRWARDRVVVEVIGVPRPNPRARTCCVPSGALSAAKATTLVGTVPEEVANREALPSVICVTL